MTGRIVQPGEGSLMTPTEDAQARMMRHGKSDLDEYCGMSCPKKWPCDAYVGAEREAKLIQENERLLEAVRLMLSLEDPVEIANVARAALAGGSHEGGQDGEHRGTCDGYETFGSENAMGIL